jgi:lysophospholipase L1-like esterase
MGGFGVRALMGKAGIIQASRISDQASVAVTAASLRRLGMVNRCTSAIIQLGINDMSFSLTTLQTNLLTLAKFMRRQGIPKVFFITISPFTTSTDGWATTANQTPTGSNGNRVTHNNWVRAGCPVNATTLAPVAVGTGGALFAGQSGHPVTGYFEVADTVESARDSGKWKAARRTVSTGAMTNGVKTLDATGAAFVAGLISAGGDVASTINVMGAGSGGAMYTSFVDTRNSATQVSMLDAASTTVSGALVAIGTMTRDGVHPSTDAHLLMSAAIDTTLL